MSLRSLGKEWNKSLSSDTLSTAFIVGTHWAMIFVSFSLAIMATGVHYLAASAAYAARRLNGKGESLQQYATLTSYQLLCVLLNFGEAVRPHSARVSNENQVELDAYHVATSNQSAEFTRTESDSVGESYDEPDLEDEKEQR